MGVGLIIRKCAVADGYQTGIATDQIHTAAIGFGLIFRKRAAADADRTGIGAIKVNTTAIDLGLIVPDRNIADADSIGIDDIQVNATASGLGAVVHDGNIADADRNIGGFMAMHMDSAAAAIVGRAAGCIAVIFAAGDGNIIVLTGSDIDTGAGNTGLIACCINIGQRNGLVLRVAAQTHAAAVGSGGAALQGHIGGGEGIHGGILLHIQTAAVVSIAGIEGGIADAHRAVSGDAAVANRIPERCAAMRCQNQSGSLRPVCGRPGKAVWQILQIGKADTAAITVAAGAASGEAAVADRHHGSLDSQIHGATVTGGATAGKLTSGNIQCANSVVKIRIALQIREAACLKIIGSDVNCAAVPGAAIMEAVADRELTHSGANSNGTTAGLGGGTAGIGIAAQVHLIVKTDQGQRTATTVRAGHRGFGEGIIVDLHQIKRTKQAHSAAVVGGCIPLEGTVAHRQRFHKGGMIHAFFSEIRSAENRTTAIIGRVDAGAFEFTVGNGDLFHHAACNHNGTLRRISECDIFQLHRTNTVTVANLDQLIIDVRAVRLLAIQNQSTVRQALQSQAAVVHQHQTSARCGTMDHHLCHLGILCKFLRIQVDV